MQSRPRPSRPLNLVAPKRLNQKNIVGLKTQSHTHQKSLQLYVPHFTLPKDVPYPISMSGMFYMCSLFIRALVRGKAKGAMAHPDFGNSKVKAAFSYQYQVKIAIWPPQLKKAIEGSVHYTKVRFRIIQCKKQWYTTNFVRLDSIHFTKLSNH